MTLSLLQLNINSDNFWDQLIPFLTSHDFDILHLQELTGKDTICGNINSKIDTYYELQKILEEKYNSELIIADHFTSSPTAYMGNATFYKKQFPLLHQNTLYLHQNTQPFPSNATSFENTGRVLLHLTLNINGTPIHFLNTHLAWAHTSKEEPHQTQQAEILINYIKSTFTYPLQPTPYHLPHPFILSADCNLDPEQPAIQKLSNLARNLTTENHITNTLNPETHRAKHLFPSGLAVDYIFTTPDLKILDFQLITQPISDHYGLTIKIELNNEIIKN